MRALRLQRARLHLADLAPFRGLDGVDDALLRIAEGAADPRGAGGVTSVLPLLLLVVLRLGRREAVIEFDIERLR